MTTLHPRQRTPRAALRTAAWIALVFIAVLPTAAWASEAPPASWLGVPTWVWAWGNLIVFWGGLFYFAGPAVRGFFERRRVGISADLDQASRQRAEAEAMRAGLESKLAELSAEMDRFAERSEIEGKKEREQVLEQARQESEKVLEQARDEIENRVAQSRVELTQLTAQLAGELARERVEARLTPESRRHIFEQNVARLRQRAEESAT